MDKLKRRTALWLALLCLMWLPGCGGATFGAAPGPQSAASMQPAIPSAISGSASSPESGQSNTEAMTDTDILVDGQVFSARLYNNETTQALAALFPLDIQMDDLNGNEKYHYLPEGLPTNAQQPGTLHAGDIMLYGPDCLVLFYESFPSTYSYTRLGYVVDTDGFSLAARNGGSFVFKTAGQAPG